MSQTIRYLFYCRKRKRYLFYYRTLMKCSIFFQLGSENLQQLSLLKTFFTYFYEINYLENVVAALMTARGASFVIRSLKPGFSTWLKAKSL